MWPLTEQKAAPDLEPAAIAAPVVDREAETRARVCELKSALDALDREMLAFKTKNKITTDRFSRLLGVHCEEINGYAAIETQWRAFLKRRDALVSKWHAALFEWSQAKEAAK